MILSILICMGAFAVLVTLLRRDGLSLGMPIAYLFSLLLIHVPGAIAHVVAGELLLDSEFTRTGIEFTAIGSVFYVLGVWIASATAHVDREVRSGNRRDFAVFCLLGGWAVTYALTPLQNIPSLNAIIDRGGPVWMVGVMIGLREALRRGDGRAAAKWLSALAVYPALMLLLGGFLSFGSIAIITVLSVLAISTRSHWRVAVGIVVITFFAFHVFLSYFQHRDAIRSAVWGGASFEQRIDASLMMVRDFALFDPANEGHVSSVDQRLNQNYFAGLAAKRISEGQVDYLHGRSISEGLIALIPRFFWPDKPVYGGSPKVVSEMTGLVLSENSSFGVGNVMEFHINFGIPGVVLGFLILGWLLRTLDMKAAAAERNADFGQVFIFFLPALALQPGGSMVEMAGGGAAALAAAYLWRWGWAQWNAAKPQRSVRPTDSARDAR